MSKLPENPAADLPLKIGITGGIGAGKSTVCRIFAALGVPVYDADNRAKRLLTEDKVLVEEVLAAFGAASYLPGGELNRVWLAAQVFDKPEQLARLNALVHPRVAVDFNGWIQENLHSPYLLKEAALIFETGGDKLLDAVITVTAPHALRLRRTLMRDVHRSKQQVEEIIKRQLPEEERIRLAQFKITNDDSSLLLPQALRLHRQFLRRELPVK